MGKHIIDFAHRLTRPIAVFDAGIGSYDIVRKLRARYAEQDLIYFADRGSFPYGGKDRRQLLDVMRRTMSFLETFEPAAIIMASNAPSIMVLDEVITFTSRPVLGVVPPIARALKMSKTGHVAVLGVSSMIDSSEIRTYVKNSSQGCGYVDLVAASDLVQHVEAATFIHDPAATTKAVAAKLSELASSVDVVTLSSTHLPWLRNFFEQQRPDIQFIDPADDTVAQAEQWTVKGMGQTLGLVSESQEFPSSSFKDMLSRVGADIVMHTVPAVR